MPVTTQFRKEPQGFLLEHFQGVKSYGILRGGLKPRRAVSGLRALVLFF